MEKNNEQNVELNLDQMEQVSGGVKVHTVMSGVQVNQVGKTVNAANLKSNIENTIKSGIETNIKQGIANGLKSSIRTNALKTLTNLFSSEDK